MSDLPAFLAEMSAEQRRVTLLSDRLVKEAAADLSRELIIGGAHGPGTPVESGAARNAWGVSIDGSGGAPGFTTEPPDRTGDAALNRCYADIMGAPIGTQTIGFENSAPYIEALDNGHSPQAPDGIVPPVIAAWPKIAEGAAARVFTELAGAHAGGES